jgi:phosphate uptake regulator
VHTRKLQRVGYSSFSLTLPREWVTNRGLKAGDILAVIEESDGGLRVEPWRERETTSVYRMVVDTTMAPTLIRRLVIGTYMLGYDTVVLESPSEFSAEQLESIRSTVRRLRGFEIVDVSIRQVVVQSFLDPTRFPVDRLLHRLQSMVSTMLENVLRALEEDRPELASEAQRIRLDVEELYWLIVRQLLLSLRSSGVSRRLGIESPLHAVGTRVVSKTLEEISSFIEAAAGVLAEIRQRASQLDQEVKDELLSYGRLVWDVLRATMKALFNPDIHQLMEASELESQVHELARRVADRLAGLKDAGLEAPLKSLLWHLQLVDRYCGVILEITVHRYIRRPAARGARQRATSSLLR